MQLLDVLNQLSSRPAPNATVQPGWANNNVTGGQAPTTMDPDWVNAVSAELLAFPTAVGASASKTNVSQVLSACMQLFGPAGYVNKFRNASMTVASRGSSGTVSSGSAAYTLDGHYLKATGASLAWAQQASSLGSAPKSLQLSCASGLTDAQWWLPIIGTDAAPLAGQTVTVQFKVKNNSGASITPTLSVKHLNASDAGVSGPWTGGSPASNTTDVNAVSLQACANGQTTICAYTFTANSASGNGLAVQVDFGGGLNASSGTVTIGDPDIRVTPGATTGLQSVVQIPEIRTFPAEYAQCAHYLPAFVPGAGGGSTVFSGGGYSSGGSGASSGAVIAQFSVPTRIPPTGVIVSSVSHFEVQYEGAFETITGLVFNSASNIGADLVFSGASSGASNSPTWLAASSASASLLFTGAEL